MMPKTQSRAVMQWILAFCSFAVFLVVYGGFVRLTRSGLSIVEWNPVMGIVPPLGPQAWQAEFAKYQITPEYRLVNYDITLGQYQEIFLIEWFHRILARIAGFIFAIPFVVFLIKKTIPLREVGMYMLLGVLFLAQAVLGWLMVSSGLIDQPAVSPYLLAAHLFLALTLIGLSVWTLLGHIYGFSQKGRGATWSAASRATFAGLLVLLVQIGYGALAAGLKAGHVSNTWPLMLGRIVPQGMLQQVDPPLLNLVAAALTVAFIHRWLAFAVLIAALAVFMILGRQRAGSGIRRLGVILVALVVLQMLLGITVVVSRVNITIALLHQANALALFIIVVVILHRLRAQDAAVRTGTRRS
jgi:cytochrome c oxidase assembly protein subunit 15